MKAIQFAREISGIALQHLLDEGFLTVEVVIERTLWYAHALQDGIYAGGGKTLFGQHFHAATQ